jgi:hypothetical protein
MAGVSTDFQDASSCPQREAKGGATKRLQCTKLHLDIFNVVKREAWSKSTLLQAIQAVAYLMSLSLLPPRGIIHSYPGTVSTLPFPTMDGMASTPFC